MDQPSPSTIEHPATPDGFRHFRVGDTRVWACDLIDAKWVRDVIADLPNAPGRHYLRRPVPGHQTKLVAFVKVYNRRPAHGLRRRLRRGRSMREASGYREFARRGIVTPRLLCWGETRRLGLWKRGFVCTADAGTPTVAERYAASPDQQLLVGAASALSAVHRSGLSHGDPRTRNFLAPASGPVIFDLCSWGRLTTASRRDDLVIFAGSSIALTGDRDIAQHLLQSLHDPDASATIDTLLRLGTRYAEREGEP